MKYLLQFVIFEQSLFQLIVYLPSVVPWSPRGITALRQSDFTPHAAVPPLAGSATHLGCPVAVASRAILCGGRGCAET